jgi:hypothetical protein
MKKALKASFSIPFFQKHCGLASYPSLLHSLPPKAKVHDIKRLTKLARDAAQTRENSAFRG